MKQNSSKFHSIERDLSFWHIFFLFLAYLYLLNKAFVVVVVVVVLSTE